jgi:hypothetical protein
MEGKMEQQVISNQESEQSNHMACDLRIESLERYVIQLEEKISHLELARDNLVTQRDDAMKRAKEKGERSAAVIKVYRNCLKAGIAMVEFFTDTEQKLPEPPGFKNMAQYAKDWMSTAKEALAFRKEERENQ